ncbi:hypothetical protein WA026_018893 [Henosepilachna vigintioctopunctata]|uniref:RRM domain-containing protein n=1 Tax=Henosepilachna vigintioctopunctata TaxID=420089 RepID=A0AAW1UEF4_9CUCU
MFKVNADNRITPENVERFNRRFITMCSKLGFEYAQVNGQRICTSIEFRDKPKSKGTEIFIGKIPRNTFEDELIPLFLRAGQLHQFRLMLDFSFKNRGFAFATYTTAEAADNAISIFDNYEIRPNFRMGVFKSVDNCRLFFGNIPQEYNKADVLKILNENLIQGVSEIIMYKDLLKPQLNRGYVFVEFASHRDAAMARKQLYPGCLIVEGQAIFVDWADPIPDVNPKIMEKVTKLFLHHLPIDMTKEELTRLVRQFVDMSTVLKVHKQMDYAFVHLVDRQSAEIAKERLRELPLTDVVVEWARPREYSKQLRLEAPPTHFCLSLPPKMRRHYQQYIGSIISDSSSNESHNSSPTSAKQNENSKTMWPLVSDKAINLSTTDSSFDNQLLTSTQARNNYLQTPAPLLQYRDDDIKNNNFNANGQFRRIYQQFQNVPRASAPIASLPVNQRLRDESYRNPLIGLPISLMPSRNTSMVQNHLLGPNFKPLFEFF